MTSRKMSFFEMWRSKKERGELLKRANQLRLRPSQLSRLLGDREVRAALQNTRTASLLPPVGEEVFRRLTPASLGKIQQHREAEEVELQARRRSKEVTENNQAKPARDLEAGKPLPFFYGNPPPELLNTPLEELDPFYKSQKTFIVLSKDNSIHRFDAEPVWFLLSPFNLLRTVSIQILTSSLFSWFIMLTILTNCVFMTMTYPPAWTRTVDYVFTAIYTFEAIIKVVSRGFCVGKFTFLRDPWNWLDVVVIITGLLTAFVDLGIVLKTVARVLKIITFIPGLKTTVGALVRSLKGLANVLVLVVPVLSVLALAGMTLFMGYLKSKCVIQWTEVDNVTGSTGINYQESINNPDNHYFLHSQLDALVCGNASDSGRCPEGYICLKVGNNPDYGYTNFDSFGWSLLSVVRLMSHYWENLVQLTLRASGTTYLTFFVLVFFPGCFCILSLTVAVVATLSSEREEAGFTELKRREEEFAQILEAIKRSEEGEQAACRAALSPEPDGENTESVEAQRSCSPCWFVFADFFLKWNCCGCWRWLKQRLYSFITSPFFNLGVLICLIINIFFMCMEHYPMTELFERTLNEADLVFTLIFTVEMLLKLVAMDPYRYFQVGWNIFDSIIVAVSLLQLTFDTHGLRWFVVMRVFRLARWWPSLHMFMKLIWTSVRTLRNLILVLLIMVFIFSVVGMQLFHQGFNDSVCRISLDCQLPRWHFCDFFHSFLIIIRVLFGEVIQIMWDSMEVSDEITCLIFFSMVLVIGNLLVLNLFLSLLLSSFSSDCLADPEEEEKSKVKMAFRQIHRALGALLGKSTHVNPDHTDNKEVPSKKGDHGTLTSASWWAPTADPEKMSEDDEEKEKKRPPADREDPPEDCCSDKCYRCCPFLDVDTSRGRGRVWSNFRRACLSIVQHTCFESIIIIIIVLSSAAMVFEDVHLQHRQVLKTVVARADQVFTCLFLMEMFLKWLAFGVKKYFSDAWSWIDFLILQVSLVSLAADIFGLSGMGAFQFLRTLRALGLLRVISRIQGLRVVVEALVRTVPSMLDFLLVVLVLWMVFSILGVNLFAGRFNYCFNETSQTMPLPEIVNNKTECLWLSMENDTGLRWKNTKLHYDNVLSSFLPLLQLAAASDNVDIMYSAVDATWVESQPIFEANQYVYLYFICFIISSFFTFNFFIRVIINHLQRDKIWKMIYRTKEQQKYYKSVQKRLMQQKPVPRPQNCFQARLFDLVTGRPFRVFMVVMVCLNLVTMMVETDQQSDQMEIVLHMLLLAFIFIFVAEFLLKVVALRQHYFTDGWNILDLVVLAYSFLGIVLNDYFEKYFVSPGFFIMLRVVHIFRLLYWAQGIRKLLNALLLSLPVLFHISLLLFILMFTSSIFGMFNFAYVKRGYSIDDMFNFETFGSSMMCLLMITTSTSWDGFLIPVMDTPPDCDADMENPGAAISGNCGSPTVAIVFFVTHIFLTLLLVVHLYIVVILETFESEDGEPLSDDDFQMFYKTWKTFDPEASQFIQYSELSDFCDALPDPLRIPKPSPITLAHMELPLLPGDRIHCSDVVQALVTQVLGDSGKMNSLKARMEEKFMANPPKTSCEPISSPLQGQQEAVAATVIQRAYRKHALQQRGDEEMAVQSVNNGGGGSALQ